MMRLALPFLMFAACTGGVNAEPVPPDARGTALTAEKLCYVFRHVKEKCHSSEGLVEFGDKTVKVETTVLTAMDLPGGAMRNLSVAFSMGGEPPSYAVQFVSKGTSVENALDRGAQEWAALAGTALVDAVRDNGRTVATHRVSRHEGEPPIASQRGPFRVYPGVSDFRGAPKGGPVVDHEGLLAAIAGQVDGLDPSRPHSLLVSMKHDGKIMQCETGQIDGEDVGEVCQRAPGFAWAEPLSPYSVRQFYVFVPGEPVPNTPEAVPAVPAASGDAQEKSDSSGG